MERSGLAIWAGVEPSVVRIEDRYVDQLKRTGHHERVGDLDLIAGLGIRTLRYPVLWERVAPEGLESADWSWSDERLERLRELGITPIVTLLHHGSGPRYTDLLDDDFAAKFAAYARAVARRYPWVTMFTPINEPLTTARFSALYGHWYPHLQQDAAFIRALLNEVAGIARAMEEIRTQTPRATLVQTEDIGKTHATEPLAYQAQFENERRWTAIDLLCGEFARNTVMQQYFRAAGCELRKSDLMRYRCEPDVLGFNYYVTSERFLDHRLTQYPSDLWGGNGRHQYADTEAVRGCPNHMAGVYGVFATAWQRYRRPLAITEAHIGCTEDEQVRWLEETYDAAVDLRATGVDLQAMTVWALFGAVDWDSLLTREAAAYESGCFDVRTTPPRETLIAKWIRARAAGETPDFLGLSGLGWWRLPA